MSDARVYLGRTVEKHGLNPQKLMKRAEAVAAALVVPPGVEFARFEHDGEVYALSARLIIQVEALSSRVPKIVVREGEMPRIKAKASSVLRRGR